jgi:hypothetical protein
MVRPAKSFRKPAMPKLPDDMSNAAIQKRVVLTKIFKGAAPKEAAAPSPKTRKTKAR